MRYPGIAPVAARLLNTPHHRSIAGATSDAEVAAARLPLGEAAARPLLHCGGPANLPLPATPLGLSSCVRRGSRYLCGAGRFARSDCVRALCWHRNGVAASVYCV
ncbi:hypothetical protein MTO96_043555 [Rhipicephalus appendiculatus]